MKMIVYGLAAAGALAFAPMTAVTVGTPAPGLAEPLNCPGGQWWDPTGNTCRPLGEGPQPLDCPGGQFWNPATNECQPTAPQPLDCPGGAWWDPAANTCQPLVPGQPAPGQPAPGQPAPPPHG